MLGDLDAQYVVDCLEKLIHELTYTTQDRHNNRPNETKIPFNGNPYNNLASYRDAVRRYRRFLGSGMFFMGVTSILLTLFGSAAMFL